jgi:hypothetical protein
MLDHIAEWPDSDPDKLRLLFIPEPEETNNHTSLS